jgi:hypothetical protein
MTKIAKDWATTTMGEYATATMMTMMLLVPLPLRVVAGAAPGVLLLLT